MDQADFALIVQALSFAAHKHRDPRRKDCHGSPYINHPIDLMRLLSTEAGILDSIILSAALPHDTLEDTRATPEELGEQCGAEIRAIVREVTDDKSLPRAERKRRQVQHAGHISEAARLVKLADKISNIRDVANNGRPGGTWNGATPISIGPPRWSISSGARTRCWNGSSTRPLPGAPRLPQTMRRSHPIPPRYRPVVRAGCRGGVSVPCR